MIELKIRDIISAVNGTTNNIENIIDNKINGISTDSRTILPGQVFVALVGEKMDGHEYLDAASKKGASLAIVSKNVHSQIPTILVNDTLKALNMIAKYYREVFSIQVIGVTGSTGKTSTKEMLASILNEKYNVHKTMLNYNNEIGLPMTIFRLEPSNEISILELGMSHEGEIKRLSDVARPNVGVITNIGTAHIENLHTRENILKAKMEITTYFDKNSLLIINGDDEYLRTVTKNNYEIKRVSLYNNGDYNATDITNFGEEGVSFNCNLRGQNHEFRLYVPGVHNIYNALCGIALGDYYSLSVEQIEKGISSYKPVGQRMNIVNLNDDVKLICDYYNANPDSMKAALNVLSDYDKVRRIAVLGDMYELGNLSMAAHKEIGEYAVSKCDVLVAVGIAAVDYYNSFKKAKEAYYFRTKEEANQFLVSRLKNNDVVLIKASNGMKMGEIADFIIKDREKVNE